MIRATTPLQEFTFDIDPEELARINITYTQNDEIILEKEMGDLTIETGETEGTWVASFRMTQEEANLFEPEPGQVQMRVLTNAGEALAGNKVTFKVEDVLNDEVLI